MVERGGGDVCVFSDLCRGGHYCLVSFSDRRGLGTLAICRVLFLYIFRKNGEVNYKNYVFFGIVFMLSAKTIFKLRGQP